MFCRGGALLLRGGIPDPGMAAVSVSLPSRVLGRSNKIKKIGAFMVKNVLWGIFEGDPVVAWAPSSSVEWRKTR